MDKQKELADASVRHGIDMTRYGNGVVHKLIALLNRVDADLFAKIVVALEKVSPESFTVTRLESMLSDVRELNAQAYTAVQKGLQGDLKDLVKYEISYQAQLFQSLTIDFTTNGVTAQQVYAGAMARPFQGRLLKEWMTGLEEGRAKRIRDTLRMGYVEGQTTAEMVQKLRGTKALGYADGLLEIDRRNAESVVRTAIGHTAGFARDRFYDANDDVLGALAWVSTLDGRTSPPCRLRDGLRYTPDHDPIGHHVPWGAGPGRLHFNCRSSSVPILKGMEDEPLFGTRASRAGQVKASTTYGDWIRGQSAAVQDDILGPNRGKLLREGGLELDSFYNDRGVYYTLEQLRVKDAAAFARAHL